MQSTESLFDLIDPEQMNSSDRGRACLDFVSELAESAKFRQLINRFILSFKTDLTQLVHFRAELIYETQALISTCKKPVPPETSLNEIIWCSLLIAFKQYFEANGRQFDWSKELVEDARVNWMKIVRPTLMPSEQDRRLDASVLRQYRDILLNNERGPGPYAACKDCNSACSYYLELSENVADPTVRAQLLYALYKNGVLRSEAQCDASELLASFCRSLCIQMIGQFKLDAAYCMALNLHKYELMGIEREIVSLERVRKILEVVPAAGAEDTGLYERIWEKLLHYLELPGYEFSPESFQPKAFMIALRLASDPKFHAVYKSFFDSFIDDVLALVKNREPIVKEVTNSSKAFFVPETTWCALCLLSNKHFSEMAAQFNWSSEQKEELLKQWLEFTATAFIPSRKNNKLEASSLKSWRQKYLSMSNRTPEKT
jgi:hypothetical protein